METEIKIKEDLKQELKNSYDVFTHNLQELKTLFIDYFGENLVDVAFPTFEEILAYLGNKPLKYFAVNLSNFNSYGSYELKEDYYEQHKNDLFLEVANLDLIKYVTYFIKSYIETASKYIIIKFPKVKVTNEYDKFVYIDNLFVRIFVGIEGNMINRFKMVRTKYSNVQWISRYSHSHLPSLNLTHIPEWQFPCLGSGPLITTVNSLEHEFNIDIWGLFCLELSKYVTVESIKGVPYNRLESIGINLEIDNEHLDIYNIVQYTTKLKMKEFLSYVIDNYDFKFAYSDEHYTLGISNVDFWIDVSNLFIQYVNTKRDLSLNLNSLKSYSIISHFCINNGKVYKPVEQSYIDTISSLNGSNMFTFKGEIQKLEIENTKIDYSNLILLLNVNLFANIKSRLLKFINSNYNGEEYRKILEERRKQGDSKKSSKASTCKVCYLL